MNEIAPTGAGVHGEVEDPVRFQHALELVHDSLYVLDVVDAVLHDGEVVTVAFAWQSLCNALPVVDSRAAKWREYRVGSVEAVQGVHGDALGRLEEREDPRRPAPDFDHVCVSFGQVGAPELPQSVGELLAAPLVPVKSGHRTRRDLLREIFPKAALVRLRLAPPGKGYQCSSLLRGLSSWAVRSAPARTSAAASEPRACRLPWGVRRPPLPFARPCQRG